MQEIMAAPRFVSGGSVANTAVGLAELGGRAGFIGAVADDEVGHTYVENLRAAGVVVEPVFGGSPEGDALGTGRCMVLISEDAERTMGTYLGAASTLTVAGVSTAPSWSGPPSSCSRATCGTWRRPRRPCATRPPLPTTPTARSPSPCRTRSASPATSGSSSTSWSTTSTSCSGTRRRSPCSSERPRTQAALEAAEETGLLVVMTRGAEGSVVLTAHGPEEVPAAPVGRVVDTTGAGDLFAAGVLYGLTHGMDPVRSARLGGVCAAEVISHTGARPESDLRALASAAGLLVP